MKSFFIFTKIIPIIVHFFSKKIGLNFTILSNAKTDFIIRNFPIKNPNAIFEVCLEIGNRVQKI